MKRFLIHVFTNWVGMNETFRAEANSELELEDLANELAYDNFESYGCERYVAEELGYDPEDMTSDEWDEVYDTISDGDYYNYYIEEFTGTEEEWSEYEGEIYTVL